MPVHLDVQLIQHSFLFLFNLGPTHGRSSLRLVVFFPSQAKHVGANVVSLLNTQWPWFPKGLTGEIKPRIIKRKFDLNRYFLFIKILREHMKLVEMNNEITIVTRNVFR